MTRTYTLRTACPMGLGEIPCEIRFTYSPGYPAMGPSYASGGEPAEPPSVELYDTCFINKDWHRVPEAQNLLHNWALEYLASDAGYEAATDVVEEDWNE